MNVRLPLIAGRSEHKIAQRSRAAILQERSHGGVTLIETIMVITLLAMVSVAGLILFDGQWIGRRGATLATTDIAKALTTARNTSINSQANVQVTRGNNNGRQQLVIVEEPGPYRNGSNWSIDLGAEVRISGRPTTIRFRPDGTTDQELIWKVSQSNVSGEVSVAPVSGQVSKTLPQPNR